MYGEVLLESQCAPRDTVGFRAHRCKGCRVCAILDERDVAASSAWHDLKGAIGDHVNASRPPRQEKDRSGRGSAGIGGEAHPLFPSPRMAQTQDVGTRAARVSFPG